MVTTDVLNAQKLQLDCYYQMGPYNSEDPFFKYERNFMTTTVIEFMWKLAESEDKMKSYLGFELGDFFR